MDEKNRKIDAVRAERQALKDATIFYKIKAAEFKEYTQVCDSLIGGVVDAFSKVQAEDKPLRTAL